MLGVIAVHQVSGCSPKGNHVGHSGTAGYGVGHNPVVHLLWEQSVAATPLDSLGAAGSGGCDNVSGRSFERVVDRVLNLALISLELGRCRCRRTFRQCLA